MIPVWTSLVACLFTYALTAVGGTSWVVLAGRWIRVSRMAFLCAAAAGVFVIDTYGNSQKTAAVMALAVGCTCCASLASVFVWS